MVKTDYDQIEIFLEDSTSAEEAQQIMDAVENHDHVKQVEYRSKEDALKILKKRWGESGYLLDSLGDNPLPNSLLVTVESLESAGEVTDYLSTFDGVEDIKYYKETVEKLTKVTNFLQLAALVVMVFLVVVSVVVVSNTCLLYTSRCGEETGQNLITSASDFPLGSKSAPPLPPPIGSPVRLFLKICSNPKNLMIPSYTEGWNRRPPL